ncbi:MAG TPA: hypothetical protein VEL74_17005 [Thermoanaerobaculia bacterium]|nr:hypothetical protein [Thermoanaerobaculia bacterium]
MPLTPPPRRNRPKAAPGLPDGKKRIFAPPRSSVPVPGARVSGEGRGPFWRLRASGGGGCFLSFFISIGLGLFLFGLAGTFGPYRDSLRESGDPRFFYAAMGMGTLFVLMAARMLQLVLTDVEARARSQQKGKASEPWTWDYPWRPEEMDPDYTGAVGGAILGRVAFLAFIAFFNIAWMSGNWLFRAIIIVLDAFALLILVDALRAILQRGRFGRPKVEWKTFPAFLGERLEGTVRFPRTLSPSGPAKATLRCVRDEWIQRPRPKGGTDSQLEAISIHEEEHEIPLSDGRLERLDLAFELKDGLLGTRLDIEQAVYWQLLLQIPTLGPDYEVIFLAPVYSRRR